MILPRQQIVALHTPKGVQHLQFPQNRYTSLTWGRELAQVSKCAIVLPPVDVSLDDITPWQNWLSVWDGDNEELLWTGPVLKAVGNRTNVNVTAWDISAYLQRDRCSIAKQWDSASVPEIAGELWEAVIADQHLNTHAVVLPDPLGDRYGFEVKNDGTLTDKLMGDLVNMGLEWSVVAGTPILGPVSLDAVAALGEQHFLGDGVEITRDGSHTYNDVLLRGADNLARARVEMDGLNLQTTVQINDMFGVSNVNKAVRKYVAHTASIKDEITLPSDAVLHPDAPITLDQLVPTSRITVEAAGILTLMQITGVTVKVTGETASVSIKTQTVHDDLPELAEIKPGGGGAAL